MQLKPMGSDVFGKIPRSHDITIKIKIHMWQLQNTCRIIKEALKELAYMEFIQQLLHVQLIVGM